MSTYAQKRVARLLTTAAGLVVLMAVGGLVAESVAAARQLPGEQARVTDLREKVRRDAAYAAHLQAEYDRQATAALKREARTRVLAWALTVAGAAFLLSAKCFIRLRAPRATMPRQVVALHAAAAATWPAPTASDRGGAAAPVSVDRRLQSGAAATTEEVDLSTVDEIVAREGHDGTATIPILQAIQAHYRYVPVAALRRVCELTDISPARLTGVATFYPQFRRTPVGEHTITVCHGTACHVAGAPRISDELRRFLRLAPGEDTDAARQFTVHEVPCLGCCTLAPVVQVDGRTHGHSSPETMPGLLRQCLTSPEQSHEATKPRSHQGRGGRTDGCRVADVAEIRVGLGSCCVANGSGRVYAALEAALETARADAVVKRVGCIGLCHQTPFIEIHAPQRTPVLYSHVQPEQARAIVRRHFRSSHWVRRAQSALSSAIGQLRNGTAPAAVSSRPLTPRDPILVEFLDRQKHIATEHRGCLDPLDLEEYRRHDGFRALERCLRELSPEEVIEQIKLSGLRGRGGAGYATWQKWSQVRQAAGAPKYVICNGDEGDPGAFMDRMLMESYPYRLIEGVALAAYATGATEGLFYIRAEYPLAVERIGEALHRCEQAGLLGDHMLGTGQRLSLRVRQGAGAFVCGEETALIASLEGQRAMPRLRPPYPAEHGLHDRPTLVNNVETFAVVPWIVRNGPHAFAAFGTPTSKGTKVFALTGKVSRGGLIEVPMGITIREIVEEIGGGVKQGPSPTGGGRRRFKAVQIGGPSGGCVPAELADTPVDYEALAEVGAMMGSGGLVVLDDSDCMVDVARYFLSFTQGQSCGECVPCRVGTRRMLEILERLCNGQGRDGDVEKLEYLARQVQQSSLCGLGKTAPNPVLTTLRYFRAEYEAHMQGRCPAGRCQALIRYVVTDACTGCTLCAQHCPADAIALRPYEKHEIDAEKCTRCDVCRIRCPEDAIRIV